MTHLSGFKKVLLLLLVILMLLALPGLSSANETSGDYKGVHWELDAAGTLTLTSESFTGVPKSGPWEEYKDKVKTLVLGNGITELSRNCVFEDYNNLTAVTFGPDIKNLYFFAFFNCRKIKTVTLQMNADSFYSKTIDRPISEIVIGEGSAYVAEGNLILTADREKLVYAQGKGKVVVPEGVKTIGEAAFYDSQVTEVVLPETLETIMNEAFENSDLQSVVLPKSLKTIGSFVFSGCRKLKEIRFLGDEIEAISTSPYAPVQHMFSTLSSLTEITIPKCPIVPIYCFSNCSKLKKVVLSEGTKELEKDIFYHCSSLQSVFIPDSVEKIDDKIFDNDAKTEIHCHEGTYAEAYAKEHGIPYKLIKSVEKVELSETELQIIKGKTADLTASVFPADATISVVEWSTSDPAVATVKNGKVKAVSGGECDITASATDGSGAKAVCHVLSVLPVQGLQTKTKQVTLAVNDKTTVEVTVKPDNATIQKLDWSSTDENICKVDANGQLEAVGAGKCQIVCTATDGSNKSVKISVTVK